MQKRGFKIELALYQDIQKVQKAFKFKSNVGKLMGQLEDAAAKDLNQYKEIKKMAESVLAEFVKKANDIGVEPKGSENYQILDFAIQDADKYIDKLTRFETQLKSAITSLIS